jgi:hypothetical protein
MPARTPTTLTHLRSHALLTGVLQLILPHSPRRSQRFSHFCSHDVSLCAWTPCPWGDVPRAVLRIQRQWRAFLARQAFIAGRWAAQKVQAIWRGSLGRRAVVRMVR